MTRIPNSQTPIDQPSEDSFSNLGRKLFIDEMWSAVIDDSDFRPMIKAWDAAFFSSSDNYELHHSGLLHQLKQDMRRLDSALESKLNSVQASMTISSVDSSPCITLDKDGSVVGISSRLVEAGYSRVKLEQDTKELDLSKNAVHLIMSSMDSGSQLLALLPTNKQGVFPKTFVVEQSDRFWQIKHDVFIKQLLNITDAELEVTKLVYLGHESTHIADVRNRSVYTIRKQVKSILEKAAVNSQRQLVQLLASILMMVDRVEEKSVHSQGREAVFSASNALDFDHFGDMSGRLLFAICPTVPASYFSTWDKTLKKHRLRLVVAHRSAAPSRSYGEHISGYLEQLSELFLSHAKGHDAMLLGFASGGVYANELAVRHSSYLSALVCVDTGYPRTHIKDFLSLPPDTRRTFIPAKYAHRLLLTPHKVVANDFFSSPEGERRVVDFFFKGQDHDRERVKSDTRLYQDMTGLISYCLADPEQLVYNVAHWVRDWTTIAKDLKGVCKVSVIGEKNALFQSSKFIQWCEDAGWQPVVVNSEGQLMLFSLQEKLLESILQALK